MDTQEYLKNRKSTPLAFIGQASRLITKVTDRISGDRSEFPLLVCSVTSTVLQKCGIGTNIFYGQAAWVEVMEDASLMWVGCWGQSHHFWVLTQFNEIVDLNTSVSLRKKVHGNEMHQPKYSPPIVWAHEVPKFYRYLPEGLAEVELDSERDQRWQRQCVDEILEKMGDLSLLMTDEVDGVQFPDEAILCPNRKILDDPKQSFGHFDRAMMIQGLPEAPI